MPPANCQLESPGKPQISRWDTLYRIGAVCAVISILVFIVQIIVFLRWPPPNDVLGLFRLLREHEFIGLLSLDLLIVVDELFAIPIFLALYVALREVDASLMLIATALVMLSVVGFVVSRPPFEMLRLSQQYGTATTDAQRASLQAAGEAMLAVYSGTSAQTAYVIGSLAMVMVGVAMLRSAAFGRVAGSIGIVSGVVGLGLYIPKVGLALSVASVFGMMAWNVLIARGLFRSCGVTGRSIFENN